MLTAQLAHIHEDRSNDIVISHGICIVIAVVAVVLRFISRKICKSQLLADDYMIILALVRISEYLHPLSVLLGRREVADPCDALDTWRRGDRGRAYVCPQWRRKACSPAQEPRDVRQSKW